MSEWEDAMAVEAAEFAEMAAEEEYMEANAIHSPRSYDVCKMSADICPECGDNMMTVIHAIEDCGEIVVTSEETFCPFCAGLD